MTGTLDVFGFLGTKLDAGFRRDRWERWRPTVALCQHDDLLVRRLHLIHGGGREQKLADQLIDDIRQVSPETEVREEVLDIPDPWDFENVFDQLWGLARRTDFDTDAVQYGVHLTTGSHVAQICLFLLTESRHFPACILQTSPDRHPIGRYQRIDLDLSRFDRLAQRFAIEHDEGVSVLKSGIATRNPAFNDQIDQIEQVALQSTAPMLLTGPTGAGKSQLAARIYDLKRQRNRIKGPFVEVNCATLRGDHAMSTLFGHTKGAFTGAATARPGLLVTADRGLLFLDEIGELGLDEQAMLLRALEEKRFLPVGADKETRSDFQLLAGTNRDLRALVAEGRFREDLLARINLWTFRLPGLRDRIEDLEPNLDYELEQFARRSGRAVRFNAEARQRYLEFAHGPAASWNGNFRDLNGSITRLATLARGGRINQAAVARELERLRSDWAVAADDPQSHAIDALLGDGTAATLDRFDRAQLADVLEVCARSKSLSAAGRELFAVSRTKKRSANDADRLRKYLARFGVEFASIQNPASTPTR